MRKRYYLLFLLLVFVSAIAFPAFKGETPEVVPIKTANYTRPAAAQSLGALYNRSPAGGMYVGLKQNMSGLFYSAHTPAFYATTNNKGLRNDPFPRQKHSNSTRILIVGDSFTFGAGVNTSQTFPEILEDMFNKNQDRHYEVINGGIFSVGLKNYYFFLKEKGIHYQPDTVVVAFTNGDSISREREEQLTEQVKTNPPDKTGQDIYKRVLTRIMPLLENQTRTSSQLEFYLDKIHNLTRRNNISLYLYRLTPVISTERRQYRQWSRTHDIPLLTPPTAIQLSNRKWAFPDTHPKPRSHRLYAQKLYSVLNGHIR